ncbi:hypothetical protein F5Y10DRAFT_159034 [Nemania abortiva]|nr:hypothetical protein F5Y10DRAFT_159034 [Nemania abortiva]
MANSQPHPGGPPSLGSLASLPAAWTHPASTAATMDFNDQNNSPLQHHNTHAGNSNANVNGNDSTSGSSNGAPEASVQPAPIPSTIPHDPGFFIPTFHAHHAHHVAPISTDHITIPPPAVPVWLLFTNNPLNAPPPPLGTNPPDPGLAERGSTPIVCVVCGGICRIFTSLTSDDKASWMRPVLVRAKPKYLEWQGKCLSARERNPKDDELIELIRPTEFLGGKRGMKLESQTLFMDTRDPLMRIPIHKACYDIARRFCADQAEYKPDFRSPSGGAPSSIPHLYEIWCKRAIVTCPKGPLTRGILEANKYFGAPLRWRPFDASLEEYPTISRFLASPLLIPDLTPIVVKNLQTMDGKETRMSDHLAQIWDRCLDLPVELFDHVINSLHPFEANGGPPLEPTRVLPPIWWKEKLFSGELIPWLWGLDEKELEQYRMATFYKDPNEAIRHKELCSYVFDERMWDWELLCRQLAQPKVMERGGILECRADGDLFECPSEGLWNRHRIWKLLNAARLGHVVFS